MWNEYAIEVISRQMIKERRAEADQDRLASLATRDQRGLLARLAGQVRRTVGARGPVHVRDTSPVVR